MPTLPIFLEVEDVAVGPVLIALKKMPGIIKMKLDLDVVETGKQASVRNPAGGRGPNGQELITALLMKHQGGPLHLDDIQRQTGLARTSIYGALTVLKSKKVTANAKGAGNWQLTDRAKRQLLDNAGEDTTTLPYDAVKLLPPPRAKEAKALNGHPVKRIKRRPKGRVSRTEARSIVLSAVAEGDLLSIDGADPRLDGDSTFGDQRQEILAEGDTRLGNVVGRLPCSKLFRAPIGAKNELFEVLADFLGRKDFGA